MKNRPGRIDSGERLRCFSSVMEQSSEGMAIADLDGNLIYINKAWCEMHGYSDPQGLIGKNLAVFHNEEQLKKDIEPFNEMVLKHGSFSGEVGHVTRDGEIFPTVMTTSMIKGDADNPVAITVIAKNMTELKEIEDRLQKTRYAIDHAADAVMWVTENAQIVCANLSAEKLLGYDNDQLTSLTIHDIDPTTSTESWPGFWRELKKTREMAFETAFRRMDGETYPVTVTIQYGVFGGEGVGFVYFRDITLRKRANLALRDREDRLSKIMIAAHDGMWDWNLINDTVYFDPRYYQMAGYDVDEFPHHLNEFKKRVHPGDVDRVLQHAQQHLQGEIDLFQVEFRFKKKTGDWIWIMGRGVIVEWNRDHTPLRFVGTHTDITDRKNVEERQARLQAQLVQAQKMESIGRLAGGMAHDFNNMLGVILGHSELALRKLEATQPLYADLLEIKKAGERSAELTRQLLAFARKQTVAPKVLNLTDTLTSMLAMLRRLIGEDIKLIWNPSDDLWPVKIDPSQIDQILVNLCVNARDAITEGGQITIETGNVVLSETDFPGHPELEPGDYTKLCVADDGCGMESAILEHAYDPFFTTKSKAKGTGLGLSTVFGIVKQNGGHIQGYSQPGEGTTFKIYLPRFVGKKPATRVENFVLQAEGGNETVLLVEDEPAILDLSRRMLEKQGYDVVTASTPGEAIKLAQEHVGEINLLMTDVVMPEMNGRELAKRLLSLYPDIKRLFMSGYTADVIAHHGVLEEGVHFLQKPFTMVDLAARVREALDQPL